MDKSEDPNFFFRTNQKDANILQKMHKSEKKQFSNKSERCKNFAKNTDLCDPERVSSVPRDLSIQYTFEVHCCFDHVSVLFFALCVLNWRALFKKIKAQGLRSLAL